MINKVIVTNHMGDELEMELARPEKSGFIIQNITGLGPVKAEINTSNLATDGELYNSSRVPARNIVMDILFFGDDIESLRQKSYKYFSVKRHLVFKIETDNRVCEIEGYTESNNPLPFSKEESTQISIICPDPYFHSTSISTTVFCGIDPLFEFPFGSDDETPIEMGDIKNKAEEVVAYGGDGEAGVSITIHVLSEPGDIGMYNIHTRETMHIYNEKVTALTGEPIKAKDDIIITTGVGNKRVSLVRDGKIINILNAIDRASDWFTLSNGDNIFVYTAVNGNETLQFTVENQVLYEGV